MPVIELPGLMPMSPTIVVGPVLVSALPASAPYVPDVPRLIGPFSPDAASAGTADAMLHNVTAAARPSPANSRVAAVTWCVFIARLPPLVIPRNSPEMRMALSLNPMRKSAAQQIRRVGSPNPVSVRPEPCAIPPNFQGPLAQASQGRTVLPTSCYKKHLLLLLCVMFYK